MTEELRGNPETEKGLIDNGGDTTQPASWYTLPVAALLFVGGTVVSLVMAHKRVKENILWSIPLVMWFAGVGLAIKPLKELKAAMQRTEEKIVTTLDQLDPMAKA
jgi:hypothetical protein